MTSKWQRLNAISWRQRAAHLLLCCLLATPSLARPQSLPTVTEELKLHFEGGRLEQNTAEMLAMLMDKKLVPLTAYTNVASADPAQLAREELKWPEGIVTDALSRALCRQNSHICSIAGQQVIWRLQKKPGDKTEPNYLCEPGAILPAYIICMPEVAVGSYVTSKRVQVDPSPQAIANKVVTGLRGCETFDGGCQFVINQMNPAGIKTKNNVPTLLLPVKSFEIKLSADADTRTKIHDAQIDLVTELGKTKSLTKVSPDIRATHQLRLKLDANPPPLATPVLDSPLHLMSHIIGGPPVQPMLGPVVVGVWDGPTDREHCALKRDTSSVILLHHDAPAHEGLPPLPERRPCGTERVMRADQFDHATFVISLIAGKQIGDKVVGANPHAAIWQLEYTDGNLSMTDPIMAALQDPTKPDLRVINISQSYEESATDTQNTLHHILLAPDGNNANYLFVVAAGNDGKTFSGTGPCNVIPACWSQEEPADENTIVSVVALDRTGKKLLKESNRGAAFDVAAIGETSGAVYGDAIADGSGTSFAAPYVSALASLLYQRLDRTSPKINPMRAKHRILFTSTFIDGLESEVRFGRIDYRRALDFEDDVLIMRNSACAAPPCRMSGDVLRTGTIHFDVAYDLQGVRYEGLTFDMSEVKRMQANIIATGETRFWVVVRKNRLLQRYHNVRIDNSAISFTERGNNSNKKISVADIDDYTSCSFRKHCDGDL